LKCKKIDIVFIIIIIILTIISFELLFNRTHQEAIENISKYEPFQNLGTGLIITFWVCVIGNLLPFPTPYTWVVCYSSQPFMINIFIPLIVSFIASLGCLAGELIGYIIGRGSAEIISETRTENLKKLQKYLVNHPKLAPLLIFIFGLTPLSDDILLVPLGLIRYSVKKTIFFCWLGKFGLMLIFAYNLINICNLIGGESWIFSIISLYVLVIMIYIFLRVDFLELIRRKRNLKE
jgi:membrane protein YqaA with SNARE-associated domain